MKTGAEYIEDVRRIRPMVFSLGEEISDITEHPVIKPTLRATAQTYDMAHDPRYRDMATATSQLTGGTVNRFNHLLFGLEDLVNRVEFFRLWQNVVGSCAVRCTGCAAINGLYATTYEMDQKYGTDYHRRFGDFLRRVQEEDLFVSSGMMDVKGDRSLGPSEQADPDLFLRMVEEREDGIVVRGAKAHQTGACISHESIIVPSRVMTEKEKGYAVAFAVANGTPGITHILQHSLSDSRSLIAQDIDFGNVNYASSFGGTSLMIFDDVFIPKERVFMQGEYESTRPLLRRFASLARMWEGGCRPGLCDLLLGAGRAIAEYNGVANAPHIVDKLTEISYLGETILAAAIAACYYGQPSPSGVFFPNEMLCAVSKLQAINAFHEASKLVIDIGGGLVMSMPSEKDYRHPEAGKYMEKYLKGVAQVPTEHRIRMFRLIESLTTSPVACALHHGGGPMQAQRVTIWQASGVQNKKRLAEALAGIIKEGAAAAEG